MSDTKVSIDAAALPHRALEVDALGAFDDFMGAITDWNSNLVKYRMVSDWQRDWRIEMGHWILEARRFGFEHDLQRRISGARTGGSTTRDPNDEAHRNLRTHMAEAMAVYYFTKTGWSFGAWNPQVPDARDVDFTLAAPTGELAAFQVGAPDVPGTVVDTKIVDGENDDWIVKALYKKAEQLPRPPSMPAIVVLCAQRTLPLASTPSIILPTAMGSTRSASYVAAPAFLDPSKLGEFSTTWKHVGAVILLDLRRGLDQPDYMCTMLLNPWCEPAARCAREWFPHARILWLDGTTFRWENGEPSASLFPTGTVLMSDPWATSAP